MTSLRWWRGFLGMGAPIGAALAAGSVGLAKRAVLRAPIEQPTLP